MKTWKQGVVGKLLLFDDKCIFIKCLKYPLAAFYEYFSVETNNLENLLFYTFIDLSVLRNIEKLGFIKMNPIEKNLSSLFSMDYQLQLLSMTDELDVINKGLLKLHEIEDCVKQKR